MKYFIKIHGFPGTWPVFNNFKMSRNRRHGHSRYELQQQPMESSIHCQLCSILVLCRPIGDWQALYFSYLTSPFFLHLHLTLSCTSSAITFSMLSCRVSGPELFSFYFLLTLPGRTTHLFSCLYVLFSAYTLLYSSSLSCIFFSSFFFFLLLRASVLLIHKSLQEGLTDWKPLSPGRMVNCFSLYDSDFLKSSILPRSTFIEKTHKDNQSQIQTKQKYLFRIMLKANILVCISLSAIYCRSANLWFLESESRRIYCWKQPGALLVGQRKTQENFSSSASLT